MEVQRKMSPLYRYKLEVCGPMKAWRTWWSSAWPPCPRHSSSPATSAAPQSAPSRSSDQSRRLQDIWNIQCQNHKTLKVIFFLFLANYSWGNDRNLLSRACILNFLNNSLVYLMLARSARCGTPSWTSSHRRPGVATTISGRRFNSLN